MTLAIDITDGYGLSNKAFRFTSKEEQGNALLAIHFIVKAI